VTWTLCLPASGTSATVPTSRHDRVGRHCSGERSGELAGPESSINSLHEAGRRPFNRDFECYTPRPAKVVSRCQRSPSTVWLELARLTRRLIMDLARIVILKSGITRFQQGIA
jgi:hypothetical protein